MKVGDVLTPILCPLLPSSSHFMYVHTYIHTYIQIISVLDILAPPNLERFEDVYIVSDLMETDLHRIIYSRYVGR